MNNKNLERCDVYNILTDIKNRYKNVILNKTMTTIENGEEHTEKYEKKFGEFEYGDDYNWFMHLLTNSVVNVQVTDKDIYVTDSDSENLKIYINLTDKQVGDIINKNPNKKVFLKKNQIIISNTGQYIKHNEVRCYNMKKLKYVIEQSISTIYMNDAEIHINSVGGDEYRGLC